MPLKWTRWAVLAVLVQGCPGVIGSPPGTTKDGPRRTDRTDVPPTPADPCEVRTVPTQPLRRLSATQYENHLADLFGPDSPLLAGSTFPPTVITEGFRNDADANTVNTTQSNAIEDNAERIAAAIIANPEPVLRSLMPNCALSAPPADLEIDGCVDDFIRDFGARAYRRPLTSSETTIARGVYDAVRAEQAAALAWASVVQFFVQSPALLYRVERGTPAVNGLVQLTSWEMASRLSFLFTNSGPDPILTQAAADDRLRTPEDIAVQARRLMDSPRFSEVMTDFHSDWLHLYEAARGKDLTVFPYYTPELQASLQREPAEVIQSVLDGEGTLSSLLGTTELPVDPVLASYYGADAPDATAESWSVVPVPNRRGLLTLASVQAALAAEAQSNPIHRGNFFRTSVLCAPQLSLPPNVDTSGPLEATAGEATARQRLAPLTSSSDCAGCHRQINPIGLAFENFDGAGRWRETENGEPIDPSGTLTLDGEEISYSTPSELAAHFAASPTVEACYATQWFRAAAGRSDTPDDACSLQTLETTFAESGGDIRELMVALTQTDAFRFRREEAP